MSKEQIERMAEDRCLVTDTPTCTNLHQLTPIDETDIAVLMCYRNRHYTDGNDTESGVIANAINNILPILVSLKKGGAER